MGCRAHLLLREGARPHPTPTPTTPAFQIWCIEHGVLPLAEHKTLLKEYEAAKLRKKSTPRPVVPAPSSSKKSAAKPTTQRIIDPTVGSAGLSFGGTEGIGRVDM